MIKLVKFVRKFVGWKSDDAEQVEMIAIPHDYDVSVQRRWMSTVNYIVWLVVGLGIWWYSTSVNRFPLPYHKRSTKVKALLSRLSESDAFSFEVGQPAYQDNRSSVVKANVVGLCEEQRGVELNSGSGGNVHDRNNTDNNNNNNIDNNNNNNIDNNNNNNNIGNNNNNNNIDNNNNNNNIGNNNNNNNNIDNRYRWIHRRVRDALRGVSNVRVSVDGEEYVQDKDNAMADTIKQKFGCPRANVADERKWANAVLQGVNDREITNNVKGGGDREGQHAVPAGSREIGDSISDEFTIFVYISKDEHLTQDALLISQGHTALLLLRPIYILYGGNTNNATTKVIRHEEDVNPNMDHNDSVDVPLDTNMVLAFKGILDRTWFRPFSTPLFDFSFEYIFAFWLVGDGSTRIKWSFANDIQHKLLYRFFQCINKLFSVTVESQVVQHGNLDKISLDSDRQLHHTAGNDTTGNVTADHTQRYRYLTANSLSQFLSISGSWAPNDLLIKPTHKPPHIRNFALYLPAEKPTIVLDHHGKATQGFHIPSWGTFYVPPATMKSPSNNKNENNNHNNNDNDNNSNENSYVSSSEMNTGKSQIAASSSYAVSPTAGQLLSAVGYWIASIRDSVGLPPSRLSDYVTSNPPTPQTVTPQLYRTSQCDEKWEHVRLMGLDVFLQSPRRSGLAEWEVSGLARRYMREYMTRASDNVQAVLQLVDKLSDLTVSAEVSLGLESCLMDLETALAYFTSLTSIDSSPLDAVLSEARAKSSQGPRGNDSISLQDAFLASRRAFVNSVEVLQDDSTMAATYLSAQMKQAIYTPLTLPFVFPLIVHIVKELIFRRKLRKLSLDVYPPADT